MKQGNIYYTDKDFTDLEVSTTFKYPCMLILKNAENEIEKITTYNENGIKSIYDFSQSASKQFVTDSIATAIVGLQDNRLEFNDFSDFPAIGDETKFYIDLTEDKIYIWDSYSQTYKNQSWDTAIIASIQASISSLQKKKLDKGTYTGNASDLLLNDQNLLQSLQNEQSVRYSVDQSLQNSKLDKGTYTGTAQDLKDEIEQKVNLKVFRSFNDFPPVHTLDSIENTNDFYLDRYTGEIFIVMYERADVDDPGTTLAYKKI